MLLPPHQGFHVLFRFTQKKKMIRPGTGNPLLHIRRWYSKMNIKYQSKYWNTLLKRNVEGRRILAIFDFLDALEVISF